MYTDCYILHVRSNKIKILLSVNTTQPTIRWIKRLSTPRLRLGLEHWVVGTTSKEDNTVGKNTTEVWRQIHTPSIPTTSVLCRPLSHPPVVLCLVHDLAQITTAGCGQKESTTRSTTIPNCGESTANCTILPILSNFTQVANSGFNGLKDTTAPKVTRVII